MLNIVKNKYMISFMLLMVSITCLGAVNEKRMEENYISQEYIEMHLS